ncbi:hypothetical protein C8F04DRAFT_1060802 [Mycena alexandri]|uniref:Uncharacterized protein n=1 Tax=Mycena alexandri TaxID=1745969 RepID=A0AAD6XIR0_9AGAR|nr:hypothetical protein C8F04DRAFT_1060802 [Mycena alexandri]
MSSFTPTSPINMSNERDWAANLGMLDWDATSIIFTKRTLMEFLKYTGTTVDTNFANIQKLPRYATFGKIGDAPVASPAAVAASVPATPSPSVVSAGSPSSADFKPSRRVRELPGGPRTNIFGDDDVPDALSTAPPKPAAAEHVVSEATSPSPAAAAAPVEAPVIANEKDEGNISTGGTGFKPSRRVREAPGGNSSLSSFWGSDEPEEFKPTRRVRQAPGGGSTGIF